MSIYDIPVTLNDGRSTTMADWQGHALLIVNTASKCGLTPQYEALQELFDDYANRGLFVIAMPCNQFAEEEPGSDEEIAEFCQTTYGVTFPILKKADVNGPNTHPLYQFLKGDGPDIEWNFEKFVVSPDGEVAGRFAPKMEPDDMKIINLLEEVLPI
ncbi:glutathione peroxidase [Corynebacterium vitaeruminis]|uniref:Glutathione peroxidase n=1 Tax=Corynebacterium vitaeruminis DSM 20294 TaxID=1224164 RepID=W5Y3X3_9CORY|nr:glutathione peroxidase [Corynebacterium vitaeruminis]AHI23565.1 glutathione peroxidase [Corynebacterium vitaeruminis DSM 20294]